VASSTTTTQSRHHRSRKRGRQNHPNWRQKCAGDFLPGSDDHCDSSSTCTESSVVEEDSSGNKPRKGGSQRTKKTNNQQRSVLAKDSSNQQADVSPANSNANNGIATNAKTNSSSSNSLNNNNNVNSNSKKEKANKKTAANQASQPKPVVEEVAVKPVVIPAQKTNPVEPNKKLAPATVATAAAAAKAKATPTPILSNNSGSTVAATLPSNQTTSLAGKKAPAKQQAKVKPNEKPPRLILKSHSEPEDRNDAGSVSASPGTPGPTIGGPSFGTPAAVATAPLSDAPKQKTKVTPVGKILPEIKKPENLGAQFGPIGAKPATMTPAPARYQ
jgi:hypothetical protein